MDQQTAIARLTETKHRITRTRELILQAIFKIKSPFSAYDIQNAVAKKGKSRSIDLVTIYRNLPILEEAGIICRGDFSDEMARYMLADHGHEHHHHHIVCKSCHKVQSLDFCIVEGQEQILKKMGFKNVSHRLEFSGICPACS